MKRLLLLFPLLSGCAKVWGLEEPVLDAGPTPITREPCFETGKVESKTCAEGSSSRVCNADGWSSWSACAAPGWRALPPAPIKGRIWHSAVWTGDELIVWGGRSPDEAFNDGAAYDPVKNTWRVIAPAPLSARIDHAAVWTGKEMLVWGGRIDGTLATTYFADGATYDPRTNTWERVPGSPMSARARMGAVWSTTTRQVMFYGGIYEFDFYAKDGAAFDPVERKWYYLSLTEAAPRVAQSSYWDGSRMIVVGGECKGADAKPCADVWAYEPSGGLWEKLADLPSYYAPISTLSSTPFGATSMALFGGEKTTNKFGNGALFDSTTKVFREIVAPTTELGAEPKRVYATLFFADGKLWVHGGSTSKGFDAHSATWDPATGKWTAVDTGLGERMAASATASHDDTFVFGGRRTGTPPAYFDHLSDGRILRHSR